MKKIGMTGTDLEVSNLCLGTAGYGATLSQDECEAQLERFFELGGNFIDTAHIYSDWIPGELGRSEKALGKWLAKGGNRSRPIISTKVAHPRFEGAAFGTKRVHPECIVEDLNESLDYLQTDCVDLCFLHRDDASVPVGELLGCLSELQATGKIRHYGCSNWTLERMSEFQELAGKKGVSGFAANQIMWSLARINSENLGEALPLMDEQTYAYHSSSGLSVMAYSSQGRGFFSRKANGNVPAQLSAIYENKANAEIFEKLKEQSAKTGKTMTDFALSFFAGHPFPAIPIVSCGSMKHLEECAAAVSLAEKPILGIAF